MTHALKKKPVEIRCGDVVLPGHITVPGESKMLVVFAHGSGSSRHSPRNNFVAEELNRNGLATLLFDLLTTEEDRNYDSRFDIGLITARLMDTTDWIISEGYSEGMQLGYFGASTGSAAALKAVARGDHEISAVVSRGGRPDLIMSELPRVKAPTLLIVGGKDFQVKQLNQRAHAELNKRAELRVVPGATHLFEEEGALEQVAELSASWFLQTIN